MPDYEFHDQYVNEIVRQRHWERVHYHVRSVGLVGILLAIANIFTNFFTKIPEDETHFFQNTPLEFYLTYLCIIILLLLFTTRVLASVSLRPYDRILKTQKDMIEMIERNVNEGVDIEPEPFYKKKLLAKKLAENQYISKINRMDSTMNYIVVIVFIVLYCTAIIPDLNAYIKCAGIVSILLLCGGYLYVFVSIYRITPRENEAGNNNNP